MLDIKKRTFIITLNWYAGELNDGIYYNPYEVKEELMSLLDRISFPIDDEDSYDWYEDSVHVVVRGFSELQ